MSPRSNPAPLIFATVPRSGNRPRDAPGRIVRQAPPDSNRSHDGGAHSRFGLGLRMLIRYRVVLIVLVVSGHNAWRRAFQGSAMVAASARRSTSVGVTHWAAMTSLA